MASRANDNFNRHSMRLEVDLLTLDESRTVNYQDLLRSAMNNMQQRDENGVIMIEIDDDSDSAENNMQQPNENGVITIEIDDDSDSAEEPAEKVAPQFSSFPSGMPSGVEQLVRDLIEAFMAHKVPPRKFFANPSNSSLLLKLAIALDGISPSKKRLIVQYLTSYLPFKKSTWIVRMKKLLMEHRLLAGERVSNAASTSEKMLMTSCQSKTSTQNKLPQPLEAKEDSSKVPKVTVEMMTQSKIAPVPRKPDYKAIDFQSMEMTRKDSTKPTKNVATELKCAPLPAAFCIRSTSKGRERNELLFQIKNVLSHYLPTRHNFFNCSLTPLLFALEDYIKPEFSLDRVQIYDHIAFYSPCSREGLYKALSKLLESKGRGEGPLRNLWCEFEPSENRHSDGSKESIETTSAVHGSVERFKFSQEKHKSREDLRRKVDIVLDSANFFNEPSAEFRETVVKSNSLFSFEHFELRIGQKAYEFAQKCLLGNQLDKPKKDCALPVKLNPKLEKLICDIKLAASNIRHFNKEFYESPILPALHELDVLCRRLLKPVDRRQVFEFLSTILPCDTKNLLKMIDGLYEPHICYIMHFRRHRKDSPKAPRKQVKKSVETIQEKIKKTAETSQEKLKKTVEGPQEKIKKTVETSQEKLKTDVQKSNGNGQESKNPPAGCSRNVSELKGSKVARIVPPSRPSTSKPEVEIFKVPQRVCDSEATKDESKTASEKIVSLLEDERKNIEETNTAINVLSQIYTDQDIVVDGWNDSERPQGASTSTTDEYHLQQLLQDLQDLKQLSTDKS